MISLTSQRVFIIHPKTNPKIALAERIAQLVQDQKKSWKRLSDGYRALGATKTRTIPCDGFSVILQFNPERIVSTAARVDDRSIRNRTCFLCVENLPDEQRGILYQDSLLILCNPAPIFQNHCTVSSVEHRPQSIGESWKVFFDLARELSPLYTIFYNGPRCGASAPDHMHFQICPIGVLPVERDAVERGRRDVRFQGDNVAVFTLNRYSRQVLVIEGEQQSNMEHICGQLLAAMKHVLNVSDEPMVNVLSSFAGGKYTTMIFPRSKHRPDAYFRTDDERLLISPAAADMGGFIVAPIEKDFHSIDSRTVENIYKEVSLDSHYVSSILQSLQEITTNDTKEASDH